MKKQILAKDSRKGGRRDGGFSLIELLVVVAIILIIVAVAIPQMLAARRTAATTAAAANLKTIMAAEANFASRYHYSWSPTLAVLSAAPPATGVAPCTTAGLLPSNFTDGAVIGGYTYTYTAGAADASDTTCGSVVTFTLTATATKPGVTGDDAFFVDETGVIRDDPTGAGATVASAPLQ